MAQPDLFSIKNPRPRCFQIVMQFGSHSFTLLEYAARHTAETTLDTIRDDFAARWVKRLREKLGG